MPREERFSRSVETDTTAFRRGGHMPEAAAKYVTLKTLGHDVRPASNAGEAAFYGSLGDKGLNMLSAYAENQCVNEANERMTGVRLRLDADCRDYASNNPNGNGYAQFKSNRYDELFQEGMSKCTTPRSSELMKGYYSAGIQGARMSAAQEELGMRKADASMRTAEGAEVLLQRVERSPGEKQSLKNEYSTLIGSMQPILDRDFPEYQKNAMQNFEYRFVRGMLKQDPQAALAYISKPNESLTVKHIQALEDQAQSEIEHKQRRALREISLAETISRRQTNLWIARVKNAEITGAENAQGLIKEGLADAKLTEADRLNLETWYEERHMERTVATKKMKIVEECFRNNEEVPSSISNNVVEDYLRKEVEAINIQNEAQGESPMTLTDIYLYTKNAPVTCNRKNTWFQMKVSNQLKGALTPKECLDAAVIASEADNSLMLKGLDKTDINFGKLAVKVCGADAVADKNILELRARYYAPVTKEELTNRKKTLETLEYQTDHKKAYANILKIAGVEEADPGWIFSTIPDTARGQMGEDVIRIAEEVYLATGSKLYADTVAASYVKNRFALTDINAVPDQKSVSALYLKQFKIQNRSLMFDAPTEERLGIPQYKINNKIAYKASKVLSDLAQNGGLDYNIKYNSNVTLEKIKAADAKKESLNWNRWISVEIDGKWVDKPVLVEAAPQVEQRISLGKVPRTVSDIQSYNYYFVPDDKFPDYKVYLRDNKTMTRALCSFRKGRN